MRRNRAIALVGIFLTAATVLAGCGSGSREKTIVVGSKDFTENILVGEMVAQLIEGNTTLKVERKLNLGGTKVVFDGVKSGDLDLYPEYDGTAYSLHLSHTEPIQNPDKIYDQVKQELEQKYSLTLAKPLGFNNTYALAMPKALADQYQIKTYSDLARHANQLVFGTTNEFMGRTVDGYDPLVKTYGLQFKDVKKMTAGLRYKAIAQNDIQVMDAYATDGKLKEFDMKLLVDDKKFFPPYHAAILVRQETLKQHPDLLAVINKLSGLLGDATMQELNYRVDVKGEAVETVARDFLRSNGLVK